MILTLEVNEDHNINRLITGSALLATNKEVAQEPPARSFYENLATYHSQEETHVDCTSVSEIKLKETQISKFVAKNHNAALETPDPTFTFAKMLIENVSVANKKKTLAKARDLAANIHY